MSVTVERIDFKGWPNSYRMTNGEVELVVTGDIGPRIIRYGFVGGRNLFKEFPSEIGKSGEPMWQNRGGHRLWVAPEAPPASPVTYAADNFPVHIKVGRSTIVATVAVKASRSQRIPLNRVRGMSSPNKIETWPAMSGESVPAHFQARTMVSGNSRGWLIGFKGGAKRRRLRLPSRKMHRARRFQYCHAS